jgi:GTP-binding protein Era
VVEPDTRAGEPDTAHRSGFVTVVGRPNVGKSTLVNRLVGSKVSIVSDKPQTTRNEVRGVLSLPGVQVVFLDTPGLHRPRTLLGERVNETARATFESVDVVCFLVEANRPIGPGDRYIAELVADCPSPVILVVNKVDVARKPDVVDHLAVSQDELGDFAAYVPVSGRTGAGCDVLLEQIVERLPEGPQYYPDGVVTDQPEAFLVAEILREKLLAIAREELPHSIAVTVEEVEERGTADDPLLAFQVRVLVERPSQKGIVIGKGGRVIKQAGTDARLELERLLGARVFLDTTVKVERDWQQRAHALDRLGF